MSVLINGMELPKQCVSCKLWTMQIIGGKGYDICRVIDKVIKQPYGRQDFCPLIPVPKHGKLIDQKELMKRFCGHCDGYEECSDKSMCRRAEECFDLKLIANTPTVIEAEEET